MMSDTGIRFSAGVQQEIDEAVRRHMGWQHLKRDLCVGAFMAIGC